MPRARKRPDLNVFKWAMTEEGAVGSNEQGTDLGNRLCKAWGLDPTLVTRLTIDIRPGEPNKVTIIRLADDDLTEEILTDYWLSPHPTWGEPRAGR